LYAPDIKRYQKPTWFVLSDTSFPPDKAIKIGQIIVDPFAPWERVGGPLPITKPEEIQISEPIPITFDGSNSDGISGGIGAMFVNVFKFGIHAGRTTEMSIKYDSPGMTTHTFFPSPEYVTQSTLQPAVVEYLNRRRVSLYMIVGVRVLHGASATFGGNKKTESNVDLGPTGLSSVGSPVDFTANFSAGKASQSSQMMTIKGDFVVAYRIRKCRYTRESRTLEPYFFTQNASMHDLNTSTSHKETRSCEDVDGIGDIIKPGGMAETDLDAAALKLRPDQYISSAVDGGCTCIMLGLEK